MDVSDFPVRGRQGLDDPVDRLRQAYPEHRKVSPQRGLSLPSQPPNTSVRWRGVDIPPADANAGVLSDRKDKINYSRTNFLGHRWQGIVSAQDRENWQNAPL